MTRNHDHKDSPRDAVKQSKLASPQPLSNKAKLSKKARKRQKQKEKKQARIAPVVDMEQKYQNKEMLPLSASADLHRLPSKHFIEIKESEEEKAKIANVARAQLREAMILALDKQDDLNQYKTMQDTITKQISNPQMAKYLFMLVKTAILDQYNPLFVDDKNLLEQVLQQNSIDSLFVLMTHPATIKTIERDNRINSKLPVTLVAETLIKYLSNEQTLVTFCKLADILMELGQFVELTMQNFELMARDNKLLLDAILKFIANSKNGLLLAKFNRLSETEIVELTQNNPIALEPAKKPLEKVTEFVKILVERKRKFDFLNQKKPKQASLLKLPSADINLQSRRSSDPLILPSAQTARKQFRKGAK